jgi:hypothetical protein
MPRPRLRVVLPKKVAVSCLAVLLGLECWWMHRLVAAVRELSLRLMTEVVQSPLRRKFLGSTTKNRSSSLEIEKVFASLSTTPKDQGTDYRYCISFRSD